MSAIRTIYISAGHFWGLEAHFSTDELALTDTKVGYMPRSTNSGSLEFDQLEVVQLDFDDATLPLTTLLDHLNLYADLAQGSKGNPDHLTAPEVVVFYDNHSSLLEIMRWIENLSDSAPTLAVEPASTFLLASEEDQHRFDRNGMLSIGSPPVLDGTFEVIGQHSDYNAELSLAVGREFAGHFPLRDLRASLDQNESHVHTFIKVLRDSLHQERSRGDTREYPVLWSSLTASLWAGISQFDWAYDDLRCTFITTLTPGNCLPRLWNGRSPDVVTHASPHADHEPLLLARAGLGRIRTTQASLPKRLERPPRVTHKSDEGRWYENIPSTRVALQLEDGPEHHITWTRGSVQFDDHANIDIERERTLERMGGTVCGCMRIADLWKPEWLAQRWAAQPWSYLVGSTLTTYAPATLTFGHSAVWALRKWESRSAAPLGVLADPAGALAKSSSVSEQDRGTVLHKVIAPIRRMPIDLRQRWLLGALTTLNTKRSQLGRWDSATLSDLVLNPLRTAVLDSLWQACRADVRVRYCHLTMRLALDHENAIALSGGLSNGLVTIHIEVPFRWLTHVWARGIAVIEDKLTLKAEGKPASADIDVEIVTWDRNMSIAVVQRRAHWTGSAWELAERCPQ